MSTEQTRTKRFVLDLNENNPLPRKFTSKLDNQGLVDELWKNKPHEKWCISKIIDEDVDDEGNPGYRVKWADGGHGKDIVWDTTVEPLATVKLFPKLYKEFLKRKRKDEYRPPKSKASTKTPSWKKAENVTTYRSRLRSKGMNSGHRTC